MPQLQYGQSAIEWQFQPDAKLKRHYVTVERGQPVLLRGPLVDHAEQEALVRRRARWIREKLQLVNQPQTHDAIVTGSRVHQRFDVELAQLRKLWDAQRMPVSGATPASDAAAPAATR